jgi:hypothetical protein
VAPGWVEIEVGAEFDRYADRPHGGVVPALTKVGLGPRLQLSMQTPLAHPPAAGGLGIGDFAVGVKWRVVEGRPVVGDFAILPSIKAPTGSADSGAGTGTTDFNLLLISSHEFGPVAMDLNVGYTRRKGDETSAPRSASLWTASFGGPARGHVGWVAELYGYPGTAGPAGAPPIVAVLAGPTFELRKSLVLDAGFIAPIRGPQPRAAYVGVTCNIGQLWK